MDRYDLRPNGQMRKIYAGEWVKFEDIPSWIPLSDRPNKSCHVMVYVKDRFRGEKFVAYYDVHDDSFSETEMGINVTEYITHYQHLPEDPEN